MEWIKLSQYNLPPQGLKILCFKEGDLWVCRRFSYEGDSIWLEIPYGGKGGSNLTDEPVYWAQVELLESYTGFMKVGIDDGPIMTFDDLEQKHPQEHKKFIQELISKSCEKVQRKRLNAISQRINENHSRHNDPR